MPDSFFASYPLLRLSLQTSLAGVSSSPKESSAPSFPLPDLRPLREASLIKSIDPSKFLCQYEVPGGGVCRDANCEDVHLSRLDGGLSSVEPNGALKPFTLSAGCIRPTCIVRSLIFDCSFWYLCASLDRDTAKYLCSVCDGLSFDLILSGLQQERLHRPNASLEELVAQTLASQRSSLPEPPPAT